MCKVLNVSESGYYRWLKNRDKATRRQLLSAAIKDILNEHPDNSNYGVNRIQIALMQAGIEVSRRMIYRAMKESGLLHRRRRPHGITNRLKGSISLGNVFLTDASMISVANCLTATFKTIKLSDVMKTKCQTIMGTVSQVTEGDVTYDFFTASASGTVTLENFITQTKGWTIA